MATPGWVGFGTKYSVVGNVLDSRFPGLDIDGTERRFCTYPNGSATQHSVNQQVAKISTDGVTWGASQTIRTPPAGYFANGADVTFISSLGFVLVYNEQSDDGAHDNNYIIICTVDGSNNISAGTPTLIPVPSGWKWIQTVGKIIVLPNGHFGLPIYGQISAHSGSVTDAAMLFNTDGTATTWGGLVTLATGDASNFWNESGFVVIPNGYANAGRIVGMLRNDDNSNVNSGYYELHSDNAESSFSTAVKVLSEQSAYVGKPALVFVPQGTSGGIVLSCRWQPTTSPLWVNQSFTGYTVSWDQCATFLAFRNYAPGVTLVQNWYSSGAYIPSTQTVGCSFGLSFNNLSNAAWVEYQEFKVTPPA